MKVLIPQSPDHLEGPYESPNEDDYEVLATRDKVVIIEFHEKPDNIEWFDDFELLYCQQQHDSDTVKVIRKATEEERKQYRIPLWIQDEDVPECCGQPMHFVGQIDDNSICTEAPAGAKYWWHDAASFYVFTCSQCLECKAVGQQY
jgi:hypothetical protein